MAVLKTWRECRYCGRRTPHSRRALSEKWSILWIVLSGGLYLPVYLLIRAYEAVCVPWRCDACGERKAI